MAKNKEKNSKVLVGKKDEMTLVSEGYDVDVDSMFSDEQQQKDKKKFKKPKVREEEPILKESDSEESFEEWEDYIKFSVGGNNLIIHGEIESVAYNEDDKILRVSINSYDTVVKTKASKLVKSFMKGPASENSLCFHNIKWNEELMFDVDVFGSIIQDIAVNVFNIALVVKLS